MEYLLVLNAIIFLVFGVVVIAEGKTIVEAVICVWLFIMSIANIIAALAAMGYIVRVA